MINKKFNKLTVISELDKRDNGEKVYKCVCDCGNITEVRGSHLRTGHTKSCGCDKIIQPSHRKSNTNLYHRWERIKERCYNKNSRNYKNYGGRGIAVCDEWRKNFKAFYNWSMENGYADNLTIDRIDVNGNYSPDNCRWITNKEQQRNKRNNVYLTYNGKTQTIHEWSIKLGIPASTIYYRYHKGHDALFCLFGNKK